LLEKIYNLIKCLFCFVCCHEINLNYNTRFRCLKFKTWMRFRKLVHQFDDLSFMLRWNIIRINFNLKSRIWPFTEKNYVIPIFAFFSKKK